MDMIAYATDGYRYTIHLTDEAANVGENAAEVFVTHLHAIALDVEDEMDVVFLLVSLTWYLNVMFVKSAKVEAKIGKMYY